MYWDEPYYEPTIGDEIFLEAEAKLRDALKDSIKQEIENLKKSNQQLQNRNMELEKQIGDIKRRELALERKEQDLEKSILRKRLGELFKPLVDQLNVWRIDHDYIVGEKCNKCDNDRQIEFTSPLGRKMKEKCQCADGAYCYYPKNSIMKSILFTQDRYSPENVKVMPTWVRLNWEESYIKFTLERYIEDLSEYDENTLFADLDYTNVAFAKQEDCQKFADYLNKKNKVPKKILKILNETHKGENNE